MDTGTSSSPVQQSKGWFYVLNVLVFVFTLLATVLAVMDNQGAVAYLTCLIALSGVVLVYRFWANKRWQRVFELLTLAGIIFCILAPLKLAMGWQWDDQLTGYMYFGVFVVQITNILGTKPGKVPVNPGEIGPCL